MILAAMCLIDCGTWDKKTQPEIEKIRDAHKESDKLFKDTPGIREIENRLHDEFVFRGTFKMYVFRVVVISK